MKREVEILVQAADDIKQCLASLRNYTSTGSSHTIDTYYYDPLRTDLQPDKNGRLRACLRTREKGDVYSITYKKDVFNSDGSWLYSKESETDIGNVNEAQSIIAQLGLEMLVIIDSTKHVFETPQYEIVLEDVKNLGVFLEVEYKTHVEEDAVPAVKEGIRTFIYKELGLRVGPELDAGKPELMLHSKQQL